jgi:hypothetical protein
MLALCHTKLKMSEIELVQLHHMMRHKFKLDDRDSMEMFLNNQVLEVSESERENVLLEFKRKLEKLFNIKLSTSSESETTESLSESLLESKENLYELFLETFDVSLESYSSAIHKL